MGDSGSESETEQLISAVQARAFLYNRKDAKYKKVYLKKQAWEHIATKIPSFEDASAAERRWNSLRGKYSTELLRVMSNEHDKPLTKWKYFDSLAFLREHVNPRTTLYQNYHNVGRSLPETSWSPINDCSTTNHIENNTDQYYSNLLSLLNNGDENSSDTFNGNCETSDKKIKLETESSPKFFKPGGATIPIKQQAKRTSARMFGEYVGEELEGMDFEGRMELQMKIMQLLADFKRGQSGR